MSKFSKKKNSNIENELQMAQPISGLSSKPGAKTADQMDQTKRWQIIYPQYLNSNLTKERGRRLGKSQCVADPLAEEIYNVLAAQPQQFQVEINMHKCYCREIDKENIRYRGYVRYCNLDNKQHKNKRQVLQYIAMMIPKLKSRQNPRPTAGVNVNDNSCTQKPVTTSGTNVQTGTGSITSGGGAGKKKNRRK